LAHSRGRGGQARELSRRQLSKVAAYFANRASDGVALLCGFAERLLCLRFLTTSICPRLHLLFSPFLPLCSGPISREPSLWLSGRAHPSRTESTGFRIRQIHPFWSALVCDCHGGLRRRPLRHGQLRCEDCTVVDFGARILGLAHRGNLPRPAEPQYARFAATLLGITVLALVLFAYLPLTITQASDVANGLNYLAIHLAPAGAAFFLAGALPAAISELPPFLKSSDPVFASRQVLKRLARYHRA